MKINIGDIVEFKTNVGTKKGTVMRIQKQDIFVRVFYSKWSRRTYKLRRKDILNCNLCIEGC